MTDVRFIGTSDPFGAGGRRQSAIFVRGPSGAMLLDCGATTGSGMNDLGIARDEIDAILISHFHGDHFGGVPLFLLAALYEDERTAPLRIAGPVGIQKRVHALAAAMGRGTGPRPLAAAIGRGHGLRPWAAALGRGHWPGRGHSPWPWAASMGLVTVS